MRHFFGDCGERKFSPLAIAGMVVGGLALAAAIAFLIGWIVMLLWNWLMPEIFGLKTISYWQAWGLVVLSHILVKPGYGGHGGHGHRGHGDGWKRRMKLRFEKEADLAADAPRNDAPTT